MSSPIIVVGLGKTGAKILEQLSRLFTKTKQGTQVSIVLIDTDPEVLRDAKKQSPCIHTVDLSSSVTVGDYLKYDNFSRDNTFPLNLILHKKSLSQNADQTRAIAYLAYINALKQGRLTPLNDAISDFFVCARGETTQVPNIIITGSLGSESSSGLLLPVSMYIKQYLKKKHRINDCVTRGLFLMPDVISNEPCRKAERKKIMINAYAAMREINAFTLKANSNLEETYHGKIKLMFPSVVASEFEDYKALPFDMCFIFDEQNAKSSTIKPSHQYIAFAAACIYAQSFRSIQMSEDAIIRSFAGNSPNYFGSAGASLLVYPYETIKEYIELNWENGCISKQWFAFDNASNDLLHDGVSGKRKLDIASLGNYSAKTYVDGVESAENDDPFAKTIVDLCKDEETGVQKWNTYIDAVLLEVKSFISETPERNDLDAQKANVMKLIDKLDGGKDSWKPFIEVYDEIETYKAMVIGRCSGIAMLIAEKLFEIPSESTMGGKAAYYLRPYLYNGEGTFVHLNAVRYFLHKAQGLLLTHLNKAAADSSDSINFINGLEEIFDDPKTKEKEDVSSVGKKSIPFLNQLTKIMTQDQRMIIIKFTEYVERIERYFEESVTEIVLNEAVKSIGFLCDSFYILYQTLAQRKKDIEKRIKTIEKTSMAYSEVRYVCASKKCLRKLSDAVPYVESSDVIEGKVAESIFELVYKKTLTTAGVRSVELSDLIERSMYGRILKTLMREHGHIIDIDVLTALETEARYDAELGNDEHIKEYVKTKIKEARMIARLSSGEHIEAEADVLELCVFNPALSQNVNPLSLSLIDDELLQFGGVPDDTIDKNMILFYQASYGVKENGLRKFSSGSDYCNAYASLVSKIEPDNPASLVVTPHLHRYWHLKSEMPDLMKNEEPT